MKKSFGECGWNFIKVLDFVLREFSNIQIGIAVECL